jgi:hypothetical protein
MVQPLGFPGHRVYETDCLHKLAEPVFAQDPFAATMTDLVAASLADPAVQAILTVFAAQTILVILTVLIALTILTT